MATTPDVRVRLSAEGVQEVVNALKAIQSQSQKTAASAKQMGSGWSAAAGDVAKLRVGLGKLSAAFAAIGGMAYLKSVNDGVVAIGRLSQMTGIGVEQLSRLSYAFQQNGVEATDAEGALFALAEKIYDAYNGAGEAADIFRAMGISVKDSAGNMKSLQTVLMELADKFAGYNDGIGKSAISQKLMSDAGAKLIPTMNAGAAGLKQFASDADKVGASLNDSAVKEATQFNKNLIEMERRLNALARVIMGPIVEALVTYGDRFKQAREAGEGFVPAVINSFRSIGNRDTIAEAEKDVAELTAKYEKALAVKDKWYGSSGAVQQYSAQLGRARRNLAELQMGAAGKPNLTLPPPPPGVPPDPGQPGAGGKTDAPVIGATDAAQKLAKARLDQQAASAAAQSALLKITNAQLLAQDSRYYEQAEISLDQFYDRKKVAARKESAAELAAARKALAAAQATLAITPQDQAAKDQAIAAARADIKQKEADAELRLKQLENERYAALVALKEEALQLDIQQQEATGQVEVAARRSLEVQIQKYTELLQKLGESKERIQELTDAQRKAGEGRINFDAAQREGTAKLNGLDERKAAVERDLSTGKIWSFEAEAQLLEIEKQRIPVLEEMYAKLKAAADQAKSPELLEQARQMSTAIADAKAKTDTWGRSMAELRQVGFDAAQQGFATFLSDVTSGTKSISGAFQSMALSVVQALQQVLAKMIAMKAMEAAFSFFGLPVPGGAAVKAATGGYIAGPGTGTSDSIPAWLSNGEFVVRAAAVSAVGLEALHEINRRGRLPVPRVSAAHPGSVQRYADGGLVGSLADATGGGSTQLSIGLDDGLILKKLSSPEGQRVLVEALGQNRRALRQLIG